VPEANEKDQAYIKVIRTRIRAARLGLGLRQEQVAARIGIDPRNYQRLESLTLKQSINPGILTIRQIALALEINLAELIVEPTAEELEALGGKLSTERAKRRKTV
jgi:transcriptional regulator with XRE-family HTH domain